MSGIHVTVLESSYGPEINWNDDPQEEARKHGLPLLPEDHPLYKSGYVIGGRRLKGYSKKK